MINFLKTAVVFIVVYIITGVVATLLFPHASHVLLNTNSVTLSSVLVEFFIYIVSVVITFLIFSSEDAFAHVLIIGALFSFEGYLVNNVPFMLVIYGFIRFAISVGLAKVIASKIRSSFLSKKD